MELTADIILSRSKASRLEDVRNLNLWGSDVQSVRIFRSMPLIEVLSLSVNKINTLADFSQCVSLKELYLRKNEISSVKEIHHLAALPNLRILWLSENPCTQEPGYRHYVIHYLPKLTKLDNLDITDEERAEAHVTAQSFQPVSEYKQAEVESSGPLAAGPSGALAAAPADVAAVEQASRPKNSREDNIMCAIIALLEELDDDHLRWVSTEVNQRLRSRQPQ